MPEIFLLALKKFFYLKWYIISGVVSFFFVIITYPEKLIEFIFIEAGSFFGAIVGVFGLGFFTWYQIRMQNHRSIIRYHKAIAFFGREVIAGAYLVLICVKWLSCNIDHNQDFKPYSIGIFVGFKRIQKVRKVFVDSIIDQDIEEIWKLLDIIEQIDTLEKFNTSFQKELSEKSGDIHDGVGFLTSFIPLFEQSIRRALEISKKYGYNWDTIDFERIREDTEKRLNLKDSS